MIEAIQLKMTTTQRVKLTIITMGNNKTNYCSLKHVIPLLFGQEMLGACHVLNQIQQNKQDRLLELEKEEQENLLAQQKMAEDRLKEIAERQLKLAEQAKMRAELNEANEEMRKKREEEKERDRLFDLQIIQIQKEKAVSPKLLLDEWMMS